MATRRKYIKRVSNLVVAIQLDLDTAGFTYRKWGGAQTCKPGDWIVNNGGDVYTVDRDTFARTYHAESPGLYRKVAPVWAEVADHDGAINTKEGITHYKTGDYIVFNDEEGQDGYAVSAPSFEAMYDPAD
jgi:hypothetical protein